MDGFETIEDLESRILYLDDHLLVVNKPSGLLIHRGWGRDRITLVDLVREMFDGDPPHPVQRLDRGTSGVIVLARSAEVTRRLNESMAAGEMTKQYLALVRGKSPNQGVIDHPIPRRPEGPRVPAVTHFETLHTAEAEPRHLSWVRASLEHGRLHQVRRHLKHINHPIIGDSKYGRGALNRAVAERYGMRRMGLHAEVVVLPDPHTGKRRRFEAPLPDDLALPLARIGIPEKLLSPRRN
ncbi:MAG: RluA family pseudouridine synthase [Deltaproteobacteria bacterium]|nr:RluA family pseudouridine synthase [Deltaproteobacteria bacterium]